MKKGGWNIMGRLIVLCLIFLSLPAFPGNVDAIPIQGAVWSTDAYKYAMDPSLGPPTASPDAYFVVEAIDFDSRRFAKPQSITYDDFLNRPDWKIPENSKFNPDAMMFSPDTKDQGIFFQFTWDLGLSGGVLPVTITHDDGFVFLIEVLDFSFSSPKPVETPQIAEFPVKGSPGQYVAIINYGALGNTDTHVLIFNTPEPGSMLLLALGILGIGVFRKRK
jgi:hypothetical protein